MLIMDKEQEETYDGRPVCGEDSLSKVSQLHVGGSNFPSTTVRHAFATHGPGDDLVSKTYAFNYSMWNI